MITYQCLRCQAVASEDGGCPSCGSAADPLGVELGRLAAQLAELDQRDLRLREEYAALASRRRALQHRMAELWTRRPRPAAPAQASEPAAPRQGRLRPPAHRQEETSPRSVQNILLGLGGLLLGVAAIVFTAVAWTTFGMVGRAAILAGTTGIALAAPVLLHRRWPRQGGGLVATAETVASLALLLVLLDGYAAWTVNLFAVRDLPPSGYSALVFTVTAVVAAGYQPVSRLAAPWFAALLAVQPVPPLLAAAADTDLVGYAVAFAGTAALNLTVLALVRRTDSPPPPADDLERPLDRHRRFATLAGPVGALTLGLFLLATAVAGLLAAVELATGSRVPHAALAGAVLVVAAGLGVVAAAASPPARQIAAGLAAAALVVAIARPVALLFPGYGLLTAATTVIAVWAVARALPGEWRTGPLAACWATAGMVAFPAMVAALIGGVSVLAAVDPVWHTDLDRWPLVVATPGLGWQPLLVLALLSAGSLLLAPPAYRRSAGHHAAVAGLGVLGIGAAAGLGLAWWSPSVIGTVGGLGLVAAARAARGDGAASRAVVRGGTGTVALGYAVGASLVRPGATAVVLAAVAVGAALVAAGPAGAGTGHARVVGGLSTATGVAVLPAAVGAAGVALHWPEAAIVPGMAAAASVGLGIAAALRLADARFLRYAVAGVAPATATTTVTVLFTGQPTGVYAAVSCLIGVAAGMLLLPSRRSAAIGNCVTAGLPFAVAVTTVVPAVLAPTQAYLWIFEVWQGTGTTTRTMLAPEPVLYAGTWDPFTLLLVTLACGVAGHGLAGARWALPAALPGAIATLLVTPVAYDWRWPTLPAVALAVAVAAGLLGGLAPGTEHPAARAAVRQAAVIWPVAGSIGLANCLAGSSATLAGLGTATGAGLLVALLGRTVVGRVTGWVVTASTAALLVHAAGLVAELGADRRPYGILGVALALLAVAATLPPTSRRPEKRATEWLAHAVAGFAIAVASPSLSTVAILFAGYGTALGLCALRPGRARLLLGAIGCELTAWWVFLFVSEVGLVEAYTVPFAVAALLGGVVELRRRPELTSWRAYGLALAAGFLPSIGLITGGEDPPMRRLAVGLAGLAVVLTGAARRRQAPVVVGTAVLGFAALREIAGLWDLLPRWVPLALAGLLLLVVGATYEQRRRDARRLRETLGRLR